MIEGAPDAADKNVATRQQLLPGDPVARSDAQPPPPSRNDFGFDPPAARFAQQHSVEPSSFSRLTPALGGLFGDDHPPVLSPIEQGEGRLSREDSAMNRAVLSEGESSEENWEEGGASFPSSSGGFNRPVKEDGDRDVRRGGNGLAAGVLTARPLALVV